MSSPYQISFLNTFFSIVNKYTRSQVILKRENQKKEKQLDLSSKWGSKGPKNSKLLLSHRTEKC